MEGQLELLLCHLSTSSVVLARHGHITHSLSFSFIICKMKIVTPVVDMCSVKVCLFIHATNPHYGGN